MLPIDDFRFFLPWPHFTTEVFPPQCTSYNLQHSGGSPGQSITLETLSFSVNGTAKMEVTSLNNALSVNVDLDGVELAPAPTGNSHSDLTVTDTSVPAGSHTLTVSWIDVCGCGGVSGDIHGSLSIIVTTGV